ncbi:ParB-like protein [Noviherbaspirillum aerium]|uniref:ParB-like protein n=1 Tax=Noviherbaspirillum aerium TaxID=2588497 RepID=UPI00178C33E1|nr:ParB-like protein [Noviherbaspirillum aerium]
MPVKAVPGSFLRRLARAAASLGLVATSALHVAHAAPQCDRSIAVGAACEINLDALHPTQPAVGMMTVEERAARMSPSADYLESTGKRPIPVVQGPDGGFYLTDSHHLASVLHRIGVRRVTAQVIGRLDDGNTFWQEMEKRHWVWLTDPKGNRMRPEALPRRIADLKDDPYRALASYAQDAGYFKKTDAYFMEFHWARYFGQQMDWQAIDRLNLLSALQTAERLACQPQAQHLPGYAGPCKLEAD